MTSGSASVRVLSGTVEGPVLPDSVQELLALRVEVEPDCTVQRGILCNDLRVTGVPFFLGGPVCVGGSAAIELTGAGRGVIRGGVSVSANLAVVGGEDGGLLRIVGDVAGDRLNLRRSIVYGNVLARQAAISECVVLGHIACQESLSLESSVVNGFHAGSAWVGERCVLLSMAATATERLQVDSPVRSLAFAPIEQLVASGRLDETRAIDLMASDVHATTEGQPEDASGFTLDPFDRVLDLTAIPELGANGRFISDVIASQFPGRIHGEIELDIDIDEIENRLFELVLDGSRKL